MGLMDFCIEAVRRRHPVDRSDGTLAGALFLRSRHADPARRVARCAKSRSRSVRQQGPGGRSDLWPRRHRLTTRGHLPVLTYLRNWDRSLFQVALPGDVTASAPASRSRQRFANQPGSRPPPELVDQQLRGGADAARQHPGGAACCGRWPRRNWRSRGSSARPYISAVGVGGAAAAHSPSGPRC